MEDQNSINGVKHDEDGDEDNDVCNALPPVKHSDMLIYKQRLKRSVSMQHDATFYTDNQNKKLDKSATTATHKKIKRSMSVQYHRTSAFQDEIPSFFAQRYTMNTARVKKAIIVRSQVSPVKDGYLTKTLSLPSLVLEDPSSKAKSKVHFADPLVTNCSRYYCRRNALCNPEQMVIPQELREKVQSEVLVRKQSIKRKLSNFFSVHLGLNLEEDL